MLELALVEGSSDRATMVTDVSENVIQMVWAECCFLRVHKYHAILESELDTQWLFHMPV